MKKIVSQHLVPGNKNAIRNIMEDGSIVYHCRTHQNPIAYGPDDNLQWIDLASELDAKSTSGKDMWLRDKNIMSVGIRKDGVKDKYLGIRPDDCQDGSEQFEISLVDIEFGGVKKKITLSKDKKTALDAVTSDLGNVVIQTTRQRARQMVRVSQPITSFKITFKIHLTGLKYVKREDLDEEWFYSAKTEKFRLRLGKPCFVDTVTLNTIKDTQSFITHTVIDNGDNTLTYIKESTKDFDSTKLPSEYFIDLDPIYSSTADGYIYASDMYDWSAAYGATTGTTQDTTSDSSAMAVLHQAESPYVIYRSFFYFNTSGISNITAVDLKLYGYDQGDNTVSAQKGTQSTTLANDDFNNFTGSEYGHTASWSTSGYNTISFNATGVSEIVNGTTKICCREYPHDYSNSAPGKGVAYQNGCYYTNNSGTDKDPYLSITAELLSLNIHQSECVGALGNLS